MIRKEQQEMKEYSNMKIGGIARALVIPETKEEMQEIYTKENNIFLLGNGSNVLLNDGYLDYTFVSTEKLNHITLLDETRVYVESGVDLKIVMQFMKQHDLSGIEAMAGIPGSIGGLTYMNGGAFGTEIFDVIESVEVLNENNEIVILPKKNLGIEYRKTEIQNKKWVVLSVIFKLKKGFNLAKVEEIQASRIAKHPLHLPSLGSTFKNPTGDFAARLIAEAGLKGHTIGKAQIAEKHPNFILNLGGATFQDILDILSLVKTTVFEKFGIQLEEEIIIVR